MAILAFSASSPSVAAAHSPIRTPAWKLSVAKVASAASAGFSGVSSAITRSPASRARLQRTGTMADVSDAVIRMPDAPLAMQVSTACNLALVVAVDLAGDRS